MSKTLTTLLVGAVGLLLTSFAPGQQPADTPPSKTPPAETAGVRLAQGRPIRPPAPQETVPPPAVANDPTQPSARLREVLGTGKGIGNTAALKLPLIAIKGRVIARDRPPAVLVSVDGGPPQTISKGTVLSAPGHMTLQVMEVARSGITIKVSPQNETIVLH